MALRLHSPIWWVGEAVTRRSAKPLFVGSNPTPTSTQMKHPRPWSRVLPYRKRESRMKNWLKGLLLTGSVWVALIVMYLGIEFIMGDRPFAAFQTWGPSARFITFTVVAVLAIGAAVGYASDVVQARIQREGR